MKCFVITPFATVFDDVYATIRLHVEGSQRDLEITCGRLDEVRPAGRITDRLLSALRECSFCVADLTGCNPNVMWETGYAMALGKPVIIITQDLSSLPFDIREMQAIAYDREQLNATLGLQLSSVVRDTIRLALAGSAESDPSSEEHARMVVGLGVQLSEIKDMVGQMVSAWGTAQAPYARPAASVRFRKLEGAWFNEHSCSYIHMQVVNGVLVAPYCYGGRDELTAYYYDWQEMGDYMFARFKWLASDIKGFSFLKETSPVTLHGAWWYDDSVAPVPDHPFEGSGNPVIWRKLKNEETPAWASDFFASVAQRKVPDFRA